MPWRRALGTPVAAATLSFGVGAVVLLLVTLLFTRGDVPLGNLTRVPIYVIFAGGVLGAFFVTSNTILAPRIGVTALVALVIAGQLTAGLVLDHFGALGLTERAISPLRILGVGMVYAGALLVRFT